MDSKSISNNIMKQLDTLHREMKYSEEIELLRKLDNLPKELKGRMAMALLFLAVSTDDNDRQLKLKLFDEALIYIKNLIKDHDDLCLGHQLFVSVLSEKGRFEGKQHLAGNLKEMQKQKNIAMVLEPNNPLNWHISGAMTYELSQLSWIEKSFLSAAFGVSVNGEKVEDALENFIKADELYAVPNLTNKFMIAKCYIKLQKFEEAKKLLKQIAEMNMQSPFDVKHKAESSEILKSLH